MCNFHMWRIVRAIKFRITWQCYVVCMGQVIITYKFLGPNYKEETTDDSWTVHVYSTKASGCVGGLSSLILNFSTKLWWAFWFGTRQLYPGVIILGIICAGEYVLRRVFWVSWRREPVPARKLFRYSASCLVSTSRLNPLNTDLNPICQ